MTSDHDKPPAAPADSALLLVAHGDDPPGAKSASVGGGRFNHSPVDKTPTGELVRAAVADEPGAWETLVRRFDGLVLAVTRVQGLSRGEGDRVAQAVWRRLADDIATVDDPDRVWTWLAMTTRTECLRLRRQHAGTAPTPSGTAIPEAWSAGLWGSFA